MTEKLILIHGWSDCSNSFKALKQSLTTVFPENDIYFVDYESREDHMSYNDVIDGLNDQLKAKKLILEDGTVPAGHNLNVIVHSTGGLVVRDFITRYYSHKFAVCPIKRLVMLAPANFGSPLAHLGKSTLGSFMAGRKDLGNFLETGQQILSGLELGSSYQWDLAERDVLNSLQFYSAKSIQTTVLVGLGKYDGVKQVVNKPGTDGTVVISGTNLNSVMFTFDFSSGYYQWNNHQTISESAFGVFPNLNHSTIVDCASNLNHDVHKTIVQALTTQNETDFLTLRDSLNTSTEATYAASSEKRYQQFLVRVLDDFSSPVRDYRIEFFISRRGDTTQSRNTKFGFLDLSKLTDPLVKASDDVSYQICDEFHQYSGDASYRRFLVDNDGVRKTLENVATKLGEDVLLTIKLHLPNVDQGIRYESKQLQNIVLYDPKHIYQNEPAIFFPNTTTLLDFRVNRYNNYVSVGSQPSTQDERERRYRESR